MTRAQVVLVSENLRPFAINPDMSVRKSPMQKNEWQEKKKYLKISALSSQTVTKKE